MTGKPTFLSDMYNILSCAPLRHRVLPARFETTSNSWVPAGRTCCFEGAVIINVYFLNSFSTYLSSVGVGVYHTGVSVFGREYSFGYHPYEGTGIFETEPGQASGVQLSQSLTVPELFVELNAVELILDDLRCEYAASTYNIFTRNCNHFTNDFCERLLGLSAPTYINRTAWLGSFFQCIIPQQLLHQMTVEANSYEEHICPCCGRRNLKDSTEADGIEMVLADIPQESTTSNVDDATTNKFIQP